MSRYRKVDPRIWNDAKFRALSDPAKLVFLFLLTHPHMTAIGAMRASPGGLADELGWTVEAFREAFAEAIAKAMAEHDERACLIALPNFLKYNAPESPNVVKAWIGALDLLPECRLKSVVIQRAKAYVATLTKAFAEAFSEAFAKAMPNQEQEQEQEQEVNLPSKPDGFDAALPEAVGSAKQKNSTSQPKRIRAKAAQPPLTAGAMAWEAYAAAYFARYGSEPVRNAKTNRHMVDLTTRLGPDDARHVAAFYVGHNRQLYVAATHATDLLVRDAEALRTQWAAGRTTTETEARAADKTAGLSNSFDSVRQELRNGTNG